MKIVLTGGGSGGHITPLLAVAHELKQLQPKATLIYIGQKGDSLSDIPAAHPDIDAVYTVQAGKFRRYHGDGLKQLVDIPTMAKNTRDITRVVRGLAQSRRLLKKLRPDVVFIKGGFVGVPVGLAAAQLNIPFVTHDSDAIPGLANRIVAKWAKAHAVALPKELYQYPEAKTFTVGVPISNDFVHVTPKLQKQYREETKLDHLEYIITVTGGGNGARELNKAFVKSAAELLKLYPKLGIVHFSGRKFEEETQTAYAKDVSETDRARVFIKGFATDFYRYSGASDIVIARGSATNLAEFATQRKACIMVPAPQLIWTIKNTETLAKQRAIIELQEQELRDYPEHLTALCRELLDNPAKRTELANKLAAFAHPHAAHELAELLLKSV